MPRSCFARSLAPLVVWVLGGAMWGGTIVGFDNPMPGPVGTLFSIDAQSGAVSPIGPGGGVALSQGPVGGTFLYSMGMSLYEWNTGTGQSRAYLCTTGFCGPVGDLAYDGEAGRMFGLGLLFPLGAGFPNPITVLVAMQDTGVPFPGVPNSTQIGYGIIGALGVDGITTIEWVPGYGLIGTDGYQALHRIDTSTGQASPLAPLTMALPVTGGITPMNGLAYDRDTGRLLGSAPAGMGIGGPGLARLYVIDIQTDPNTHLTAAAGWLNDSPPNLTGIAAVNPVPEPGSMLLTGLGLLAVVLGYSGWMSRVPIMPRSS